MKKTQENHLSNTRWDIVLNGKLYEALPPGKVPPLTVYMNQTVNPPMSEEKVRLWFGDAGRRVPRKHREFFLEIMADALRDVAEQLKTGMSEKAIALKKEADKAAGELTVVKQALELDSKSRVMEAVR